MRISPFAKSYLRLRAAKLMVSQCTIWHPQDNTYDPAQLASIVPPLGAPIYVGQCRFWRAATGVQTLMGEEIVTVTETFLSIPYNSVVPVERDIARIDNHDDPTMIGRTMQLIGIARGGSLRGSRVFSVRMFESAKGSW